MDAVLGCCEDYKLRRAKACVGSEIQGILSIVTSHKSRQQPELLTSELLGSNRGSKESVSGFSSEVCSGQPNFLLSVLPSKVYSTTPWPHELETRTSTRVWGHVLHSGCNILPERLICRQNEVPLIYTFELCSPERVPLFAGSLKGPTSCMDLPLRNLRDHFNCFPLIDLYQMEILL